MGRKSKSSVRKPEILENLYRVINREGLEGTTLSKVADEMGVNSGLLVHYFKTKEEMIIAMVDYMLEKYANIYISKLNEFDDPRQRMDNILDSFFEPEWTRRGDASVFWSCYSLSFRNQRVKERFREMYKGFRRLLADEITGYMDAGIVVVKDPEKTAGIIITLIEGMNFYDTVTGDEGAIKEAAGFLRKTVMDLLQFGEAK